jgi:hypothetical protein
MADEPKKLPYRWQRFVDVFLIGWNATQAAELAGFKHPRQAGSRLLSYVDIRAALKARMEEYTMQANEVLYRLAQQARANIADFVTLERRPILDNENNIVGYDDVISLNWDTIHERGYLVKSITSTQYGPKLELHDSQTALITIGKHLQLFRESEASPFHLHFEGLGEMLNKAYGAANKDGAG